MKRILADTCCCSNFALIGRWDIIEKLYPAGLAITEFVVSELRNGIPKLPKLASVVDAAAAGSIEVIDQIAVEELAIMQSLPKKFSAADKSCIAIAEKRAWFLLTDEADMQKECARRKIQALRTEDVLREAVQAGILNAADLPAIADEMEREANFRPRI